MPPDNSDANAIDVFAVGDVTIVNDGDVLAYSNYGSDYVTAVYVYSTYGTRHDREPGRRHHPGQRLYRQRLRRACRWRTDGVTVNNAGSIAGSSFTSNATGVNVGSPSTATRR